jgi:mannose-6-phosphate isomerase-like protein (cupin superfamily)
LTPASVQADNRAGSIEIKGYVVSEQAVPGHTEPGDTAEIRLAIDASSGCERLEQRVIRFQAGRSSDRRLNGRQEMLYVAAGRGSVEVNGERTLSSRTPACDEVVYVVEGEGVLHLGGTARPIAAGSCIHLPPLEEHCLENTGDKPMRVLGVFHPSGDPASKAHEAKEAK